MMKNFKTFILSDKPWLLLPWLGKGIAGQIQSYWKKTRKKNQKGLEGRKEIKPPKIILMALGKFSQRYSEGIKLNIILALEEWRKYRFLIWII
jgi:hypothetical protein